MNLNIGKSVIRFALPVIPGMLMPLAFSPYHLFFLAYLCPAVLLIQWINATPAQAFRQGYLFGLGMFGGGVYWLYISINLFGGVNLALAILVTALLVAYMSVFPAMVAYLGRRYFAKNDHTYLLIACPALWIIGEWVRSWLFTGFPWLNIGYTQTDSVLSSLAPLFGVYGLSWVSLLISALLALLYLKGKKFAPLALVAIFLIVVSSASLKQINWTQSVKEDIRVALIQGGIPQELKWLPEMREKSLEQYLQLSYPYWGYDLIIWPETAIPAYQYKVPDFLNNVQLLTKRHGTTFLSGIPALDSSATKYYNSVIMLTGEATEEYHKQHLVPFGEYLPLKKYFGRLFRFLQIPMSDFSPGEDPVPILNDGNIVMGVSICYEDTFGEEVIQSLPDATVLINISNDAWFGDSLAPHQHLQMARMRALETGRFMLRSTNTGVSAIINEKGNIIKTSPQFVPAALGDSISLFEGQTPYSVWGNLPVIVLALMLLTGALALTRDSRKAQT